MSVRAIQAGKAVILVQAVDLTGNTLSKISRNMKNFGASLTRLGEQSMRGGLLGGIASGLTLKNFFKFDDLMKELQSKFGYLGDMTKEQTRTMATMENRIRSLGKTTSYTSQQVAEAAIVLAQGGLEPTEVKNSLQAILDLGRGTRTELDMAANMYVRAMRSFNISSDEASSTVSQFVRATRYGVLELSDLEAGLRYSSGTAATLGQNLAPILAILTQLSNVGLAGSIGGTSLNTAMANLVKKLEAIKERFPGFEPAKKNGDLDLLKTLERLYYFTSRMSKMERIAVFQELFNLRGARAIAGAQDIESILGMAKAIEKAGNEARIAADLMDSGPGGSWRKLTSAVDDLSLALGKAAEGPIVSLIHAGTQLANTFNTVTENNKGLAAALILSPGIMVAAGVGFILLGKTIAVVGSGFGLATVAIRRFLGIVSGGTVRQVAALSMTMKELAGARVASMGLGQMARGTTGAAGGLLSGVGGAGKAQAAALRNASKMRAAQRSVTTNRALAQAMWQARNINLANKYATRAQAAQRLVTRFSAAGTAARGARGAAMRSIIPSLGRGAMESIRGIRTFTVAAAKAAWATRRLIPSWFTLIEIFVLFGDKIPGVSYVWNQFANGFTAAGGALGRIATYLKGPLNLLFASFEALYKGDAATGINGIIMSLKGIWNIIINQLVSAWNLFKASIAGTWDTLRVVFLAISQIVDNVITRIGAVVDLGSGAFSSTIGKMFSGDGSGIGQSIIEGAQWLMKGLNKLFYWGDIFVYKLREVLVTTAATISAAIAKAVAPFTLRSLDSIESERNMEVNKAGMDYNNSVRARDKQLAEQNGQIDKLFKSIADEETKKTALRNSAQREQWSQNISNFTDQMAERMRASTNAPKPTTPQGDNGFQKAQPMNAYGMSPALQQAKGIAGSLVGYASSVANNRLKFGSKIDKKQLDVLEEIRDNTKDMKDRADTFE